MRDFQIYLSGGMGKFGKENFEESDKWRRYCKRALENYEGEIYRVNVINPNDYFSFRDETPQYKSNAEVMRFDLYKLRKSDLVIMSFNDKHSLGSAIELGIAYDRDIPIIGLDVDNQELHPWLTSMCERIFNNIDEMIDYIKDFYLR